MNKVLLWIEENLETNEFTIEDFPLFPHGKRIIDQSGDEMVVYLDILRDQVEVTFPN